MDSCELQAGGLSLGDACGFSMLVLRLDELPHPRNPKERWIVTSGDGGVESVLLTDLSGRIDRSGAIAIAIEAVTA